MRIVGACRVRRVFANGAIMTDRDRMFMSIAIDAANSCIHVFEKEYPNDDRSRKALEDVEKWLKEPARENHDLVKRLEINLSRSNDWGGRRNITSGAGMFIGGQSGPPSPLAQRPHSIA
jgi:hypothetical protein